MSRGKENSLPREFWALAGSQFTSNLADGMTVVVFTILASYMTASAATLGLVVSALSLPWFVFSAFAGTLIDISGAHTTAVRANLSRALLFMGLALLFWLKHSHVVVLTAFALAVGVFEVLSDNAHSVLVPQIIPEKHLERANSISTTAELVANRFIGVTLGGLLVGVSPVVALGLNGSAYLLCALLLFRAVPARKAEASTAEAARGHVFRTLLDNLLFGLRYLWTHRSLGAISVLGFLWNFSYGAQQSFLILFVTQSLRLDERYYSTLFSAMGVGGFVGGFVVNWAIAKLGRARTLLAVITLCALQYPIKYSVPQYPVLVAAAFIEGLTVIVFSTIAISYRHRSVEEQYMGRVTASSRLVSLGALPLGTLAGGVIADTLGFMMTSFLLGAALFFPGAILILGIKNMDQREETAQTTEGAEP